MFIINEQYDASLLVLQKKFCWSYTDIFHISIAITNSSRAELSREATEKLLSPQVNFGEKLLYDAIIKIWWAQPEVRENGFWKEVCISISNKVLKFFFI